MNERDSFSQLLMRLTPREANVVVMTFQDRLSEKEIISRLRQNGLKPEHQMDGERLRQIKAKLRAKLRFHTNADLIAKLKSEFASDPDLAEFVSWIEKP